MKLKIAIQKSGRLFEESVQLLKECGIGMNNGKNQLRTTATNFPLEILFLRDDDIPQYVEDAVADIGIVGENVVLEKQKKVSIAEPLGFGSCRLSIAVPKNFQYENAQWLQGKKIASVEIAPSIGLADAICDLVSSGSTLFSNGLKETEVILKSQALLIANSQLTVEQKQILEKFLFRIRSVKKAKSNKYILLNAPNNKLEEIIGILPGMKSPTVVPLATEGWSSIHSVVQEDDFWNIIENLKQAGAEGILVVPIEKMIL
jgi:ATP phosphoribosyltransferase